MSEFKSEFTDYKLTYYEILGLSEEFQKSPSISSKKLRAAYRHTLLQHHPDKTSSSITRRNRQTFTVDQISQAFSTLLDPLSKAKYDHEIKMRRILSADSRKGADDSVGMETIDLEELESDEHNKLWYKSCRCGNGQGYLILEKDLEAAVHDQEIYVECRGCSLMLKVLFAINEEI
ncbi:Diphthamide biosynthesis protein 4 [Erysiphe necator]|uniref:Diphthamide biosynthesis protein 4 n=1 Tax=Uncinula necator TaxID=52586 RepID=A0A0B1P4Q2_UNCNE|nr:Diphthamide biosynthesis protein 4 [Erysiphe necator]KHJ33248.1 hypothetical protein EV44_g3071 [Erysiphe necator]